MTRPRTIPLSDYHAPRYLKALALGDLFPSINGWEVMDVDILPDARFARVTLWHDGRAFKLLMLASERVDCVWMGSYWIEVERDKR